MKSIPKTTSLALAGFSLLFAATGTINAQIINIQVGPTTATYVGTGADANDTGTTFNAIGSNVTNQALVDQSGGATSALFTSSGVTSYADNTTSSANPAPLFAAYAYIPTATTATFAFSGLTADAGDTFSLYLYGGDDGGNYSTYPGNTRSAAFTLTDGGSGSAIAYGSDNTKFTQSTAVTNSVGNITSGTAGNYVVLGGTIGADGIVMVTATFPYGTTGNQEADVNGLQLDITPGATTPEPSTCALMLGGMGLLAFVVRRRLTS